MPKAKAADEMKRYWVRFYSRTMGAFEYHGPWWVSGSTLGGANDDEDVDIVCCAVMARDEDHAKAIIDASFDEGFFGVDEWSFCDARPAGWEPFADRFQRAKWMQWPDVTGRNEKASAENRTLAYGATP